MSSQEKLTGVPLYMIMLGMLVAGTCNTVFLKLQDSATGLVDEKGKGM